MRLNFSGINVEDIREGIRRIGEVIAEQVRLYGTLTGVQRPKQKPTRAENAGEEEPVRRGELARVLHLPRKHAG
jgi:2-aminoadipate transaminase